MQVFLIIVGQTFVQSLLLTVYGFMSDILADDLFFTLESCIVDVFCHQPVVEVSNIFLFKIENVASVVLSSYPQAPVFGFHQGRYVVSLIGMKQVFVWCIHINSVVSPNPDASVI